MEPWLIVVLGSTLLLSLFFWRVAYSLRQDRLRQLRGDRALLEVQYSDIPAPLLYALSQGEITLLQAKQALEERHRRLKAPLPSDAPIAPGPWHSTVTVEKDYAPAKPTKIALPLVEQHCSTCTHFDHEAGQALRSHHGPFAVAARYIPPSEMGAQVTPEGETVPRDIPEVTSWDEFGLCRLRHEGLWGRTNAERRARMKSDKEGPFLAEGKDCYELADA